MQRFRWMGLYVVLIAAALMCLIAVVTAFRVPMAAQ